MITTTKLNIVLDIGKTNVKLIFVDSKNTAIYSYNTKQKSILPHANYQDTTRFAHIET